MQLSHTRSAAPRAACQHMMRNSAREHTQTQQRQQQPHGTPNRRPMTGTDGLGDQVTRTPPHTKPGASLRPARPDHLRRAHLLALRLVADGGHGHHVLQQNHRRGRGHGHGGQRGSCHGRAAERGRQHLRLAQLGGAGEVLLRVLLRYTAEPRRTRDTGQVCASLSGDAGSFDWPGCSCWHVLRDSVRRQAASRVRTT
jgi:hypothetical protein